jgi:hypothetical protein
MKSGIGLLPEWELLRRCAPRKVFMVSGICRWASGLPHARAGDCFVAALLAKPMG